MPAKSKAQYRFMKGVESGSIKAPGLSPEKAKDWTSGMTKDRFKKLKERLKNEKTCY
jgi:hypothetical protein